MNQLIKIFFQASLLLSVVAPMVVKGDGTNTVPQAGVTIITNIVYYTGKDADATKQCLDLYLPKGKTNFPVVLFIHGGGYQHGERAEAAALGIVFAKRGVAVASIDYRLYPQVMHPAHMQDVARAFAWVKQHIKEHGGDSSRVFVSGHSAGGHLAALLATDESYLKAQKLDLKDIKGVLAMSGGYRIQAIRKVVFGSDEIMAQASPFSHIHGGHPPFLILYGSEEKMERHELSAEFRDALKKVNTKAECVEIKGRDHAGLLEKVAEGDPCSEAMLSFIETHP